MRLWKKILIGAILLLTILSVLGVQLYKTVQADLWTEEDAAIKIAREKTDLVNVSSVDPYVEETSMMIVHGSDAANRRMLVWVGTDFVHAEYADAGVDKEAVRKLTLEAAPDAELLRITPGIYQGSYVWQSFYRSEQNNSEGLYYRFYSFYDGALLDVWELSR